MACDVVKNWENRPSTFDCDKCEVDYWRRAGPQRSKTSLEFNERSRVLNLGVLMSVSVPTLWHIVCGHSVGRPIRFCNIKCLITTSSYDLPMC